MARKHKILTIDKLRRRNHFIVNGCPMCLKDEETVHHLLIHCNFAYRVCVVVFKLFDIEWVMPRSVEDLFLQWHLGSKSGHRNILWKLVFYATHWKLSLERNKRVFRDTSSIEEVVDSIIWSISEWVSRRKEFVGVSLEDLNRS